MLHACRYLSFPRLPPLCVSSLPLSLILSLKSFVVSLFFFFSFSIYLRFFTHLRLLLLFPPLPFHFRSLFLLFGSLLSLRPLPRNPPPPLLRPVQPCTPSLSHPSSSSSLSSQKKPLLVRGAAGDGRSGAGGWCGDVCVS